MKGRKPLPTAIHLLNGNPGKRKLPETLENKFSSEAPEPPTVLEGEALAEWQRIIPLLAEVGILKRIDRTALAAYCLVYQRWIEAEEKIKTMGYFSKTPRGFVGINPYLKIIEKCLEQMKTFMADFGMTPASRVRLRTTEPEQEGDDLDAWLNGNNKKKA